MIWKSVVSFLFFVFQSKKVLSSKSNQGFFQVFLAKMSQNYVFLNAHSLPLNCKIRKKRRIWIFQFLFWEPEMELFFFHFRKVVSLNDLDRVVQLARRGTLNKIRPRAIELAVKNGFTITKMFLMDDISDFRGGKEAEN